MSKVSFFKEIGKFRGLIILGVLILLIDQFVKFFVTIYDRGHSLNIGLAFGFAEDKPVISLLLHLIGFLILTVLGWKALFKNKDFTRWQQIIFIVVYAAGLSNLADRILRGGVVDFISLPYIPSFNLADMFISVGTLLFLVSLLIKYDKKPNN